VPLTPPQDDGWIAFVDESESNPQLDPDVYILAAALVHGTACEKIRAWMDGLRLDGQRKLHWAKESASRRDGIIHAVESLDVLYLVVLLEDISGSTSERRRRRCLERLLWELIQSGVRHVVLEARERTQNKRDLDLLTVLASRHRITARPRVDHLAGPAEPLLWLADVLAGALVASRCGDPGYWERLAMSVEMHRL
jgi:hypothetical protein